MRKETDSIKLLPGHVAWTRCTSCRGRTWSSWSPLRPNSVSTVKDGAGEFESAAAEMSAEA